MNISERLTKERHTRWVYRLEFSQVFLKMILAQLHSFFQDFLLPFRYCLCIEELENSHELDKKRKKWVLFSLNAIVG